LGGPGVLVDDSCGRAVDVKGRDVDFAVSMLSNALMELAGSQELLISLGQGARRKAEMSTWETVVGNIYDDVERDLVQTHAGLSMHNGQSMRG